jgi:hypothetical protein
MRVQRNLVIKAIVISFMVGTFVIFAITSWYQNPRFENLFSYQGSDFPSNPLVSNSTKGIGVHFFGDLLESSRIVSTDGSPYIKASGTYLPFSYSLLRIFGSLNYTLLCWLFLLSVGIGIALVTQISHKLNREIKRADFLIILLSWPMLSAIDRGNIQVYITLLLVLSIVLVTSGHDLASAITIGLVGGLKGYPILFLLIFLGRRRAKENISAGLATCLLSNILALLTFSGGFLPNLRGFVNNFTGSASTGNFPTTYNNSLRALFESVVHFNLLGLGNFSAWALTHPTRISVAIIFLAVTSCALVSKLEVRVALVATCLILTSPYSPPYMLGLLLAVVTSMYLVEEQSKAYAVFAVVLAILLSPKMIPLGDFSRSFDQSLPSLNSIVNPLLLLAAFFYFVVYSAKQYRSSNIQWVRSAYFARESK